MKKKTVKKSARTQKSDRPVGLKKSKRKTSQKSGGVLKTTLKPLYIDLKNVIWYHCPLSEEQKLEEHRKFQRKQARKERLKNR